MKKMDTTAVFWESKIKTYGFELDKDLTLVRFEIPLTEFERCGVMLASLGDLDIGFRLVLGQILDDRSMSLSLVVDRMPRNSKLSGLGTVLSVASTELIAFHGPHYGDRPGIIYNALKVLSLKRISMVAAGCSVSSIYLALKSGLGERALDVLMNHFKTPDRIYRRNRKK